jgi:hypothetical protein
MVVDHQLIELIFYKGVDRPLIELIIYKGVDHPLLELMDGLFPYKR